jgi:hypothetical protein
MIEAQGFDFRRGLGIFIFATVSRTALGPTQLPLQWLPGALSLGIKQLFREADHSPPCSAEVKECVELCLHSPNTPSWRGAQLKKAQRQLQLLRVLRFIFHEYFSVSFQGTLYIEKVPSTHRTTRSIKYAKLQSTHFGLRVLYISAIFTSGFPIDLDGWMN